MNYKQLKVTDHYYHSPYEKNIRRHKQIVKETNMAQHSQGRKETNHGKL